MPNLACFSEFIDYSSIKLLQSQSQMTVIAVQKLIVYEIHKTIHIKHGNRKKKQTKQKQKQAKKHEMTKHMHTTPTPTT